MSIPTYMTASERFAAYLSGKPVDRVPVIEWAPWWNVTVERWLNEGLPPETSGYERLQDYFGLDKCLQTGVTAKTAATPQPPTYGLGIMEDEIDYETKVKPTLFPDPASILPAAQLLPARCSAAGTEKMKGISS